MQLDGRRNGGILRELGKLWKGVCLGESWTFWSSKVPPLGNTLNLNILTNYTKIIPPTVLTHLTCASLTEDRYGVVQRDIPRILEALLSFLTAVEAYQAEIEGKYKIPTAEELAGMSSAEAEKWVAVSVEVGKAGEALGDVAGGTFHFFFKCLLLLLLRL
jgi:nucleoporin NDC1